jgi:ATP-dependent exoDNAse (exonuclease V) beta subunit
VLAPVPYPAWSEWIAQRDDALAEGLAPRVWSATAIATAAAERAARADPGLAKDARDLELPPWNKGRYGTAVGSAVHAVLQTVDLVDGRDIDETAAAQAAAEGVIGREHDIAALARSALASRTVREAVATDDYRREMYVATQVEGHTLEGYVDLVYRTPEGLVVVDYKTDAWRDESDLDAKVARYRLQGASYALALEAATGEPVARCVFLFLGTDGADERAVRDLPQALEEVRALLAASAGSG